MDSEDLYQEVLLDHARHPHRYGKLRPEEIQVDLENPLCGDRVCVHADVEEGRVARIRFDGQGCAISTASASLLGDWAEGRPVEEVRAHIEWFAKVMRGEAEPDEEKLGDLMAVAGVRRFPMRIKCATLAWHALRQAIDQTASPTSPDSA